MELQATTTKVGLVSFEVVFTLSHAILLGVPIRSPAVTKPVFFGAAKRDAIGVAQFQIHGTTQACSNLTVREIDAGHWIQLEKKDEVNQELGAWLDTILAAAPA